MVTDQERAANMAESIGRGIVAQRLYARAKRAADAALLRKLRATVVSADQLVSEWQDRCRDAGRAVSEEAITAELLRMAGR